MNCLIKFWFSLDIQKSLWYVVLLKRGDDYGKKETRR